MNAKEVIKLYKEGWSTYQIAEKYKTYSNKIKRLLKKHGIPLRSKSEAQSLALKSGRHQHPTKGKERSTDVKVKISQSMTDYFDDMTDKEKEERFAAVKEHWESKTDEEKAAFIKTGVKAIRRTRDEGSKIEKFVFNFLSESGYNPVFHDNNILPTRELEVDISIPAKLLCIEVDGPSHHLPIWGKTPTEAQKRLKKQRKFDKDKNALLTSKGFSVLRIGFTKDLTVADKDKLKKEIVKVINKIKKEEVIHIKI